jgi:DNA-binding CsgD family transcriptional regulator
MAKSTNGVATPAKLTLDRKLTPRQMEVAELVALGLTNEQIALRLTTSVGTIANHVGKILLELDLRSRVQIATEILQYKQSTQSESVMALLEKLRQVPATTLTEAAQHATDVLSEVFAADKVDVFLYRADIQTLVALGTSRTAMGRRQQALGLNRLPVAHGGRVGWIFQHWQPYIDGDVQADPVELVGVRRDLGVQSTVGTPLEIAADQRGVLLMASALPDRFTSAQLRLLQFVAYWFALVAREAMPA